jgi:hypothetical protein
MIISKIDAIVSLVPGAEVLVVGEEVTWFKPSTAPVTEEQIQTELTRLQAEYEAKEYQRKRAAEYPPITEQLDKIFHDGIDEWKKEIQAVKDKYPKGE